MTANFTSALERRCPQDDPARFRKYGEVFLLAVFDHLAVSDGGIGVGLTEWRDTGEEFDSGNGNMGEKCGHALCAERQDGVSS